MGPRRVWVDQFLTEFANPDSAAEASEFWGGPGAKVDCARTRRWRSKQTTNNLRTACRLCWSDAQRSDKDIKRPVDAVPRSIDWPRHNDNGRHRCGCAHSIRGTRPRKRRGAHRPDVPNPVDRRAGQSNARQQSGSRSRSLQGAHRAASWSRYSVRPIPFNICAEHAKELSKPGMEIWECETL